MQLVIDINHVFEEIAVQHRPDGDVADNHRRNRQQNQRQGNHPRAFVRVVRRFQAVVVAVVVVMVVLGLAPAFFAVEDDKVLAEGVKRGNEHAGQHGEIGETAARQVAGVYRFDNRIFRIEAGEQRRADEGEVAQQHGEPGNRHVFAQAAHIAHVLVVVHTDNHAARRQEQQGFEEGVGHHMEHGHGIGGHAQSHGHVAKLRQGGIGHHAFDVVLNRTEEAHKQRGNRANHHNHAQSGGGEFVYRRHARHHEQAGGYHRCGVNQRGNRGRTFHGIGQPHMQRELGGFTHRADKQQQAGDGNQIPAEQGAADHVGQVGEHVGIAQAAAEIGQHQADAEYETEVAHAVDQKGFQVGENRAVAFEIEAD